MEVYGVGVFLRDVAEGDLEHSQFYADVNVYILKHYLSFPSIDSAVSSTTLPLTLDNNSNNNNNNNDKHRLCDLTGEKSKNWFFLKNVTQRHSDAEGIFQHVLKGVNIGKFPRITPVLRHGNGDGQEESELDHIRIQSEWTFSPSLLSYPFSSQSLPIKLELPGDVTERVPGVIGCWLGEYSGFGGMESQGGRGRLEMFTEVEEKEFWPPYSNPHAPSVYPISAADPGSNAGVLLRSTSRLTMTITQIPHPFYPSMILLPSLFILLSTITISHTLPPTSYPLRIQCLTTALLGAVVQHSNIRGGLPRGTGITKADGVMACVYLYITMEILSTGITSVLSQRAPTNNSSGSNNNNKYNNRLFTLSAHKFRKTTRYIPLCSLVFLISVLFSDGDIYTSLLPSFFCFVGLVVAIGYYEFAGGRRKERRIRGRREELATRASNSGGSVVLNSTANAAGASELVESNYQKWTIQEVTMWLKSFRIGSELYTDYLRPQRLDGRGLLKLDLSALRGFGVCFGEAVEFMEELERLRERGGGRDGHEEKERRRYRRYEEEEEEEEEGKGFADTGSYLLDSFTNMKGRNANGKWKNGNNNNTGTDAGGDVGPNVDPMMNFENAEQTMKERFGNLPLPSPRGMPPPSLKKTGDNGDNGDGGENSRGIELTSKRKTGYEQPFEGLPRDLMDMMPPDIRAIAERNPQLVQQAIRKSDTKAEKRRQAAQQQVHNDMKTVGGGSDGHQKKSAIKLSQVQRTSLKKKGHAERFVGAAAAADILDGKYPEPDERAPPPTAAYGSYGHLAVEQNGFDDFNVNDRLDNDKTSLL